MEVELCKQNRGVKVTLRVDGQGVSCMTAAASTFKNVIWEKAYSLGTTDAAIFEVAKWAETKLEEVKKNLDGPYPWWEKGS